MILLGKKKTDAFKARHPDARSSIEAWEVEVEAADWANPYEMKERYPTADPVGDGNTVFNIKGNKYRLWARISYELQTVVIKNAGTHREYTKWPIK